MKPTPLKRTLFFIFFDIVISLGTLFLAYNLRFSFSVEEAFIEKFLLIFAILTFIKISSMAFFHIYKVAWRFFSLNELKKILYAHLITYPLVLAIYYLSSQDFDPFPRSVLIIDFFLSMLFLGFFRILKRLIIENDTNIMLDRTLLIGATPLSQTIIKDKTKHNVVAIVDDEDENIGTYFYNLRIDSIDKMRYIIEQEKIKSVIIAKEFNSQKLNSLYEALRLCGILDIALLLLHQRDTKLKKLSIEDLLARHPKDLDKAKIEQFIKGKVILVTGAGGSIGSEISRQCIKYGVKKLLLLDHSEFNLYTITEELRESDIVGIMHSVTDKDALEKSFKKYKIDIVIHAAAYKHVHLVEENIDEALINNIVGTKNVIDLSIKYGVKKFVLISTDKAVRPTSVMGATKRVCELYAQNIECGVTEIVSVRFGNVLGSSGSVIPKFSAQIEAGGPITVTHPEVTRYFMLISEACELVLQAASIGRGGEVFILDMGEAIKIIDLAKKMIELSKKRDIEIVFSGLRAGEKLYEELMLQSGEAKTEYDSIMVASKTIYDIQKLQKDILELLECEDKLTKLREIVPEFERKVI